MSYNIGYEDKRQEALTQFDPGRKEPDAILMKNSSKQRPAMEIALDTLHQEIDRCTDVLTRLEERISPIMTPENPSTAGSNVSGCIPSASAVVSAISTATTRLATLRQRMTDYLDRLET